MSSTDDTSAGLFDGRYRITGRLGQGGMARVLLAEDLSLHRKVALKVLDERYADDSQFLERFDREARAAAGLNHPNIVQVYDRGEAGGQRYIAMEYLEGETLKALIQREGPLAWRRAIDISLQVLAALRFAHRHGIVHRDVKPQNILMLRDGRVKVMDFGIARAGASQMTETGAIIGTAQYLAPEQARGLPVGPPADLYSAGIVLYEMLTARVPFDGDSAVAVAMKHLQERAVPVGRINPSVPPDLVHVVERAMTKDPTMRYQSADEMGIDLDRVRKSLPVAAQTTRETAYIPGSEAATRVQGGYAAPQHTQATAYAPPLAHQAEPERRGGGGGWLAAGAIALLIVGLAVAALLYLNRGGGSGTTTGSTASTTTATSTGATLVRIPRNIKGLPEADARALLVKLGFDVNPVRRFNPQVQAGFVIDTDPPSGTSVEKGRTIDLIISRGVQLIAIKDVTQKPFAEAQQILVDQGFVVRQIPVSSTTVPKGDVVEQSPQAGEQRAKGTTVTLSVSSGPAAVNVPSLVGLQVDAASAAIVDKGLVVGKVVEAFDPTRPIGEVISSDPPGGQPVQPGTTVNLVVSKGPQTASVPDERTKDVASAKADLIAKGFKVAITPVATSDPNLDGTVQDQDPQGNTDYPLGKVVTLFVYQLGGTTTDTTTTGATT